MSSKTDLFALFAATPVEITVGGQTLYLRRLSAGEISDLKKWQKKNGDEQAYQILCARSLVTADGVRIFTDDDAASIADLPAQVVETITAEILSMNKLDPDAGKVVSPTQK